MTMQTMFAADLAKITTELAQSITLYYANGISQTVNAVSGADAYSELLAMANVEADRVVAWLLQASALTGTLAPGMKVVARGSTFRILTVRCGSMQQAFRIDCQEVTA